MTKYDKLRIALRYFLLGKGYYQAADALEFAATYHTGLRKDGVTPEFMHQIEIAHYLRSLLPSLLYPEDTITTAILHDTPEDYGIKSEVLELRYNKRVAVATELLNKNRWSTKEIQFTAMAGDPIASIVKGADRQHNLQSMIGVFSTEKQQKYMLEVTKYFLPMLKQARHNFVAQESAYENVKHVLESQLELLAVINGVEVEAT